MLSILSNQMLAKVPPWGPIGVLIEPLPNGRLLSALNITLRKEVLLETVLPYRSFDLCRRSRLLAHILIAGESENRETIREFLLELHIPFVVGARQASFGGHVGDEKHLTLVLGHVDRRAIDVRQAFEFRHRKHAAVACFLTLTAPLRSRRLCSAAASLRRRQYI